MQNEAPGAAEEREQTMSVFLRVRPFSKEELSDHEDQVAQLLPAAPQGARDNLEYHRCYSINAGVDSGLAVTKPSALDGWMDG